MRPVEIVRETVQEELGVLHKARQAALWRAVEALVKGGRLWLTALGRDMPGTALEKHRIKAIDRLLGNHAVQLALGRVYQIIATCLLRNVRRPAILVDWTGCGAKFYLLRAAVPFCGRAIPLHARVVPKKQVSNKAVEREFLNELATIMPEGCRPTIVTDAGFYVCWFQQVSKLGWDFVGRLRGKLDVHLGGQRFPIKDLFTRARKRATDLGSADLKKDRALSCRLILAGKHQTKGRRRLTRKGERGCRKQDYKYAAAAKEPWLLATSLDCETAQVVDIYSTRMQLEETFRDVKSNRFGWSFNLVGCKDPRRIEVLLLIGTLASIALATVGAAAERRKLQRQFQANTESKRRVLSLLTLGRRVLAVAIHMSLNDLRSGLTAVRRLLERASPLQMATT